MSLRDLYIADALAKAWHEELEPIFGDQTHCIEAAKIARAALARVKVPSRPLPCGLLVANPEGSDLIDAGVPITQWPATAWSIGVDPDSNVPGPGWNGHLILAGDGWIGDFSAAQFRHSKRRRLARIDIEAWVSPTPPGWDLRPISIRNEDHGTVVVIQPRPELARWRSTNAWRSNVPTDWVDKLLARLTHPEGATI